VFARHAAIAALTALLIQATAQPAAAVFLTWQNAAGGSAEIPSNWNPSSIPAAADILRFDLANTFTVTFDSNADSVASHQIYDGDVTYDLAAPHGVSTEFHVAPLAGQVATARILSGTLRLGWTASVGAGGGATGTLRINGGTTNVGQNMVGVPASGPVMNIGGTAVGGGTGEVIVLNGGQLDLAHVLNVGRFAGSTGTLRVKGAGNGVNGLRRSHVFADGLLSDCHMGLDLGHGILEVQDGGLFRVGRDLIVGEELGDVGDITIVGENAIDSSQVRVKGDLLLAANGSAGVAGGTGTITLDSLGVLVVDDSTVVGDADGSTGLITINPHARMMTKHLILQQPTGGTVALEGGLLQVNGGTLSTYTNRLALPGGSNSNASRPALELINGATATMTGTPANPPLIVGTTGAVDFRVTGGSQVVANGGSVTLAEGPGAVANVWVSEGGQLTSDRSAVIGVDGMARLAVETGGLVTFDGVDAGVGAPILGHGGYIGLSGGGVLTSSGPFNLGGTTFAAGNAATVDVANGGVLNLTAPIVAGNLWSTTTTLTSLHVHSGGLMNMTGLFTVRGLLDMNGGDVVGGIIALRDQGTIVGEGVVQCGILGGADTTVTIIASGPLEIGRDTFGGDVLMRGRLSVGSASLTVHDPDSAVVGNVEMTGGELHLPAGGGLIEAGKHLVGDGTIHGPLVNHGRLISEGADGLRFAGTVYGIGEGASGDQFVFLSGGGFEGTGIIGANVQADAGSLIRATGNLILGKFALSNTLVLRGRIETGNHMVWLRNLSATTVEGEIVLDGGMLLMDGDHSLTIQPDAMLQGRGSLLATLSVAGTVAPGNSAGQLYVAGNVILDSGTLEAELGNHAGGEWDTLLVSGRATLGGNLALLRLPSYAAAPGDSFQILGCDSLIGEFANVTLDGAPLAGEFEVHYAADGVWIVALQPTVDVGDGNPGSAPVAALRLAPLASPGQSPGVELALPAAATVEVRAYDVTGREVGSLCDGELGPGRHRFVLSREVGGAGMFFVRALIDGQGGRTVKTVRVVRLK
jgi:hypothetical protein